MKKNHFFTIILLTFFIFSCSLSIMEKTTDFSFSLSRESFAREAFGPQKYRVECYLTGDVNLKQTIYLDQNQKDVTFTFTKIKIGARINIDIKVYELSATEKLVYEGNNRFKTTSKEHLERINLKKILLQGDVVKNGISINGGAELSRTTEIVIIPEGTTAIINMIDDSSWNTYYGGTLSGQKGVYLKDRIVQLSPYAMSAYEVTQELYEAVMETNPSLCVASNSSYNKMLDGEIQAYRPVENISWYNILIFCNKLSVLCGLTPCYTINGSTDPNDWGEIPTLSNNETFDAVIFNDKANGYRLPTEAEWEFAARGGDVTKPDWKYSFSGIQTEKTDVTASPYNDAKLNDYGWYTYNLSGVDNKSISQGYQGYGTHEVGKKEHNRLGLYDMSGNILELCYDWYNEDVLINDTEYLESGVVKNPRGPSESNGKRVARGGYWNIGASNCLVSTRFEMTPYYKIHYLGFRLVRSL